VFSDHSNALALSIAKCEEYKKQKKPWDIISPKRKYSIFIGN